MVSCKNERKPLTITDDAVIEVLEMAKLEQAKTPRTKVTPWIIAAFVDKPEDRDVVMGLHDRGILVSEVGARIALLSRYRDGNEAAPRIHNQALIAELEPIHGPEPWKFISVSKYKDGTMDARPTEPNDLFLANIYDALGAAAFTAPTWKV